MRAYLGGKIDASKLIAKAAGKYSVRIITKVGALDFTFTEVANLAEYGVRYIEMLFNSDGVNRSDFAFKLYGADGEISDKNLSASVKAYHSLSDLSDTVLKSGEDYCKFTKEGDYVCYSAYASVPYTLIKEYSIYVVKNDLVTISADKNVASPGEAVRFEIIKKIGIEIVSILVTDRNGEAIDFDEKNNAVVVTDSDIVISVTAKYTEYDIVFLANGVVVSHQKLTYGEMPKLPSDPVKPADGEYSYVFSGWSPEVDEVTQSIVYEAHFEKISLDSGDDSDDEPKTFFGRFFKSIKDFFSNLSMKFSLFLKNIF